MKKLSLLLVCLMFILVGSCTEDETIEEQVFKQQNPNLDTFYSGEEGDQDLDRDKRN